MRVVYDAFKSFFPFVLLLLFCWTPDLAFAKIGGPEEKMGPRGRNAIDEIHHREKTKRDLSHKKLNEGRSKIEEEVWQASKVSASSLSSAEVTNEVTRILNTSESSHYFRQVGERILDDDTIDQSFGYSVDISGDGKTVVISGMCKIEQSEKYFYRVKVFEEIDNEWYPKGTSIDNVGTTAFMEDSRAHVSISGDGKKISIATVFIKNRNIPAESMVNGSVDVYEYGISNSNDWILLSTEYAGNAGSEVATTDMGLKASLDTTGSKIAIGLRYFDGSNGASEQNIGAVMVCTVGDSSSCRTIAMGKGAQDFTGSSVMISGSAPYCVIFGSIGTDTTGNKAGSASIYCDKDSNNIWMQRGATLNGEGSKDEFGSSVAISSDSKYIAISSYRNDRSSSYSRDDGGHVRVFKFDINTNEYIQIGSDIDGERGGIDGSYYVGDYSGYSIALSDERDDKILRVAIGAPNNEGDGGYYNGHIRLYECDTAANIPVWTQVLDDIDGTEMRESAGRSLAMNMYGTRMIFGSPEFGGDGRGYYTGSASVYELAKYTTQPSMAPSYSPTITTAPSSSPSLSAKIIQSPEQDIIFEGLEELTDSTINHWKTTTETSLLNEFSNDSTVIDVTIIISSTNRVQSTASKTNNKAFQSCRINYEILITRRAELDDAQYNTEMRSLVAETLTSQTYISALTDTDSSVLNGFETLTNVTVGEFVEGFQIRSNYAALDFSNNTAWCISAKNLIHGFYGGAMLLKKCDETNELQVWSTDSFGQLKLVPFPQNPTCINTQSRNMFLAACDSDTGTGIKDETKSFSFVPDINGTWIKQVKNSHPRKANEWYVGIQAADEIIQTRLFRNSVGNDSLNKWDIVNGKYSTASKTWEPSL